MSLPTVRPLQTVFNVASPSIKALDTKPSVHNQSHRRCRVEQMGRLCASPFRLGVIKYYLNVPIIGFLLKDVEVLDTCEVPVRSFVIVLPEQQVIGDSLAATGSVDFMEIDVLSVYFIT